MSIPRLRAAEARKMSIVDNSPAFFVIDENPYAVSSKPFYEFRIASEVARWCGLITFAASQYYIDPTLVKAIMYMETTHGWYDRLYPARKTILPMNIHYRYWRQLGVTKESLACPYYNIEYGVILLSRIKARLEQPTVRKIATLYNFIGAEEVNDYGARVAALCREQPWNKVGGCQ